MLFSGKTKRRDKPLCYKNCSTLLLCSGTKNNRDRPFANINCGYCTVRPQTPWHIHPSSLLQKLRRDASAVLTRPAHVYDELVGRGRHEVLHVRRQVFSVLLAELCHVVDDVACIHVSPMQHGRPGALAHHIWHSIRFAWNTVNCGYGTLWRRCTHMRTSCVHASYSRQRGITFPSPLCTTPC